MSIHVTVQSAAPEDIRRWLRGPKGGDLHLSDLPSCRELDLDRDWDGLHYLLTGSAKPGRGPLAFLSSGGREVNRGANERLFRPSRVRQIDAALAALPMGTIRRRFKPRLMATADVYRGSWDEEPPHQGVLFDLVKELKAFVRRAGERAEWLVYRDDA